MKTGRRIVDTPAGVCAAAAVFVVITAAHADDPCQPHWDAAIGQPGVNGISVRAMKVFDDGTGPALYVGGGFTEAGGVEVNGIARWDGEHWSAVGDGMNEGVRALTIYENDLIAGGRFTTADGQQVNRIARWDGSSWQPLGSGFDSWPCPWSTTQECSTVNSLAVHDGDLIAGGRFTTAGGVEVNHIAKWDGEQWSPLGDGLDVPCLSDPVENCAGTTALTVVESDAAPLDPGLYVGGWFDTADGVETNSIARWDGEQWVALDEGVQPHAGSVWVSALTVVDDPVLTDEPILIAGGNFATAGGIDTSSIAKWDGQQWSALAEQFSGPVGALAVFDDGTGPALYAAGLISTVNEDPVQNIARWHGAREGWSDVDGGVGPVGGIPAPWVLALTPVQDADSDLGPALYVGGRFTEAGSLSTNFIASWNGCPPKPAVPGDLTGDGTVGGADLGILLSQWGECFDPDACPADLTGDGEVGGADLGTLLSNWTG